MSCRVRKSCYEGGHSGLRRGKCAVGGARVAKVGRDDGTSRNSGGPGGRERDCFARAGTLRLTDSCTGRQRIASAAGGRAASRKTVSRNLSWFAGALSIERRGAGFGGAWDFVGEDSRPAG